jgi:hypothetical protein
MWEMSEGIGSEWRTWRGEVKTYRAGLDSLDQFQDNNDLNDLVFVFSLSTMKECPIIMDTLIMKNLVQERVDKKYFSISKVFKIKFFFAWGMFEFIFFLRLVHK